MDITTRIKNSVGGQGPLGSAEYVGEGVASLVAIPRAHRPPSPIPSPPTPPPPPGANPQTARGARRAEGGGAPLAPCFFPPPGKAGPFLRVGPPRAPAGRA